MLGSLTPEELATVARHLLSQRPELVGVAETIAVELYSGPSIESVASDVLGVLTLLDIQDVDTTDPLGGYVEPGEAACEALREHVSEFVDDMKRRMSAGLTEAAETICRGIVLGLWQATENDDKGLLAWAPDFPADEAENVVEQLLRSTRPEERAAVANSLIAHLDEEVPDWAFRLRRAVERALYRTRS